MRNYGSRIGYHEETLSLSDYVYFAFPTGKSKSSWTPLSQIKRMLSWQHRTSDPLLPIPANRVVALSGQISDDELLNDVPSISLLP